MQCRVHLQVLSASCVQQRVEAWCASGSVSQASLSFFFSSSFWSAWKKWPLLLSHFSLCKPHSVFCCFECRARYLCACRLRLPEYIFRSFFWNFTKRILTRITSHAAHTRSAISPDVLSAFSTETDVIVEMSPRPLSLRLSVFFLPQSPPPSP